MVEFRAQIPNFYIRDPRAAARSPNGFYNEYYGNSTNAVTPYEPLAPRVASPVAVVGVTAAAGVTATAFNAASIPVANILPNLEGSAGFIGAIPGVSIVDSGRRRAPSPQRQKTSTVLRNAAVAAAASTLLNPLASTITRLANNNLPMGADFAAMPVSMLPAQQAFEYQTITDPTEDNRVIITDPTGKFTGSSPITYPLTSTGGVLFPFTPQIQFSHKANYESESLVHTNYDHPYFRNSSVEAISVSGTFTASNSDEARYILAVIHFFRSVTKMFYGQDALAGTPPPILYLDGYGNLMIDHVPVVVTSFEYQLPQDVDYISIEDSGASVTALVPTNLTISVSLKPTYSRNIISNNFGLEKFVNGNLITGNRPGGTGPGGFI